MASLDSVCTYLAKYLRIEDVPDYPNALNGLQVAGRRPVKRIVAAVDACGPVIDEAVAREADLLLVHHGLFWSGVKPIEGALYDKLSQAIQHGLAIYSAHIPLDVHSRVGNNALLGKAIGLREPEPFLPWKGILLGLRYETRQKRKNFVEKVRQAVGGSAVHCAPGGPATVRRVGVITGGAGSMVEDVAAEGIDTFITGEGAHHTYTAAEEAGVNLIYAGHYATETFGVKALADHLAKRFKIGWEFIDHPTGL